MYLGIPSQLAQTYWLCLKDFSGLCYTSWEKTKMKVVVENHLFRPTPPPPQAFCISGTLELPASLIAPSKSAKKRAAASTSRQRW